MSKSFLPNLFTFNLNTKQKSWSTILTVKLSGKEFVMLTEHDVDFVNHLLRHLFKKNRSHLLSSQLHLI